MDQFITRGIERWVVAFIGSAIIAAIVGPAVAIISTWFAILIVLMCLATVPWIARSLPEQLKGGLKRHPILSILWLLFGVFAVFQMGRLSAFMSDPTLTWGSVVPDPNAIRHQCMSAYVHAADLARRGEPNIYAEHFYPAFTWRPGVKSPEIFSPVKGLSPYIEDPYQYPPPFLVLPRIAIAFTDQFLTVRTIWFVLQSLVLIGGAVLLGIWIGGREGLLTTLLLPSFLASLPIMFNFQFGQFHAMTVILAIGAMVAFQKRRVQLGGALLSFAILSKIFPGVLLIYLAAQRRWREILWTVIFGVVFTGLGLLLLGIAPFRAFLSFELPRLINGDAFSFIDREGVPIFIQARNFSIYGLIVKLRFLDVPGMTDTVSKVAQELYALVLLGFTILAARFQGEQSRLSNVQIWFSILLLASLRTPLAPSAYVMAPALFLLCLLAADIRGRKIYGFAFVISWILMIGTPPLPDMPEILIDLAGQSLTIAIGLWVLIRKPKEVEVVHEVQDHSYKASLT